MFCEFKKVFWIPVFMGMTEGNGNDRKKLFIFIFLLTKNQSYDRNITRRGNKMRKIRIGSRVKFKKKYKKKAEEIGLTGILTVESIEKGTDSDWVKFKEDKNPIVIIFHPTRKVYFLLGNNYFLPVKPSYFILKTFAR